MVLQVKPQQLHQTLLGSSYDQPKPQINSSSSSALPGSMSSMSSMTGIPSPPAQTMIFAAAQMSQYTPFPLGSSQLITPEPRVIT